MNQLVKTVAPQARRNLSIRRLRLRKIWLKAHLYVGLVIGTLFVFISLTGSLIVFASQIDAWLNADIMRVESPQSNTRFRPVEDIVASAEQVIPPGARLKQSVVFPKRANGVFQVLYQIPPALDNYQVMVNPYSGEVLGQRLWGTFDSCCSWHGPLMAVIYRFHDSFWLAATGSILTGSIAILMMVSLISGTVLWWPKRGRWRSALTIKCRASAERFNYDLHKVFGVYSAVVLLILLFTGAYLSLIVPFPEQVKGLIGFFSPLTEMPQTFESKSTANKTLIDLEQAITIANRIFPEGEIHIIRLPDGDQNVYKIFKHQGDEILFPSRLDKVVIDANNGKVLYRTDRDKRSAGDTFIDWQLALHSGEAFGLTGKIVILIVGLAPLVLYVTGILRWQQKRKVAKLKSRKLDSP